MKFIADLFKHYYPSIEVPEENAKAEVSWFGVPLVFDNKELKHELQQYLEDNGIQTRNYFAGNLLLHPGYKHLGDAKDFENAYQVLDKVFFLGCHPGLTEEHLNYIKETVIGFMNKKEVSADGYSVTVAS